MTHDWSANPSVQHVDSFWQATNVCNRCWAAVMVTVTTQGTHIYHYWNNCTKFCVAKEGIVPGTCEETKMKFLLS